MSARRKSCRKPAGEPCVSVGKHGLCGACHDMTAHSERMRKLNADPEFAKAHSERSMVWPDCPEHLREDYETLRHYMSAREARATLDPAYAAKQSA